MVEKIENALLTRKQQKLLYNLEEALKMQYGLTLKDISKAIQTINEGNESTSKLISDQQVQIDKLQKQQEAMQKVLDETLKKFNEIQKSSNDKDQYTSKALIDAMYGENYFKED